jgi:hypothetical protein
MRSAVHLKITCLGAILCGGQCVKLTFDVGLMEGRWFVSAILSSDTLFQFRTGHAPLRMRVKKPRMNGMPCFSDLCYFSCS